MGLFKWVKDQYYDFRLNNADNCVSNHQFDEAKKIYTELLGKHELAVVQLAKLLDKSAQTERQLQDCLQEIAALKKFLTLSNRDRFEKVFQGFLGRISTQAADYFNQGNYASAVRLIQSLMVYKNIIQIQDRLHKYKAYEAYHLCTQSAYQQYNANLTSIVNELNQISTEPWAEVKEIVSFFVNNTQYVRAIKFLLAFEQPDLFPDLLNCVLPVLKGLDKDFPSIDSLTTILPQPISVQTAKQLASLSIDAAKNDDFKTAVLYDSFAAPLITDNKEFNYNRCIHIFNELRPRAEANEIKSLLDLSHSLGLTNGQIAQVKLLILNLAQKADNSKAIRICQLFPKNADFGKVYIDKALYLCKQRESATLNLDQLLDVIQYVSTEETLANNLGRFVPYFYKFDNEYYKASVSRIIKEQDTILLDKYWTIKPSVKFFERLITPKLSCSKLFIDHIIDKHPDYLFCEQYKAAFCHSLTQFDTEEYVLDKLETLIKKRCAIDLLYSEIVIDYAKRKDQESSLVLANRALRIAHEPKLIGYKKNIIKDLIQSAQYELAIEELNTLLNLDPEAWTLLAECYFAYAHYQVDVNTKITLYQKIVSLSEQQTLASSFQISLDATFEALSTFSIHFYDSGEVEKAYSICQSISSNKNAWIQLYTTLRAKEYDGITTLGQKITHIESTIATIKDSVELSDLRANEIYNQLWVQLSKLYISKAKSQPYAKAIDSIEHLITLIQQNCDIASSTEQPKLSELKAKLMWKYAVELEHDCSYVKAISLYLSLASSAQSSLNKEPLFRAMLCKLKANLLTKVDEPALFDLLSVDSFEYLRADLAYRYAYFLIQSNRIKEAQDIVNQYLPNETELIDVCKNMIVKQAESKLAEFNNQIERLKNNEMTWQEAANLHQAIDEYASQITPCLTDLSSKFQPYKSLLKGYMIKTFFQVEDYARAFSGIKRWYSINSYNHYRNLAIAAIGILESDNDNPKTINLAISTALSAIYTDHLFVHSLEHTSWDDPYEFTLQNSLGCSSIEEYDDLPDNVTDDDPVDNKIIAIRDVQNALLIRIETAIREKHSAYEEYFNQEKSALEKLLSLNLDDANFVISTPGFASVNEEIQASIKESLDYEYNQNYNNQEDVLAVGLMYGFTGAPYSSYKNAQIKLTNCKNALASLTSTSAIANCFSSSNIARIKQFDSLFSELRSACSTSMNKAISEKIAYKKFLDRFEPVCQTLNDAQISMTCANYINSNVVTALNNDAIKLREGIGYMLRIYNLAPSNIQVKDNLKGILTGLIHEAEQTNEYSDRKAVSDAIDALNGEFDALIKLSKIIAKLKNERIEARIALEELYDLYKVNRTDSEVCESLVAVALACIHKYLFDPNASLYHKTNVKNILTSLSNNQSSTFQQHAKKFAAKYVEILSQVPQESKILLLTPSNSLFDSRLNEKGRALKEGLNIMSKLGGIDQLFKRN